MAAAALIGWNDNAQRGEDPDPRDQLSKASSKLARGVTWKRLVQALTSRGKQLPDVA